MAALSASSLLKQLKQWCHSIYQYPLPCGFEFLLDVKDCALSPHNVPRCYVALGVAFVVLLVFSLLFALWVWMCNHFVKLYLRKSSAAKMPLPPDGLRKFQQREREEIEKKKKKKLKEEKNLKCVAESAVDDLLDIYSESGLQYNRDMPLPDMGSRLDKYWYRVTSQETYSCHILTVGALSSNFTCDLEVEGYLNKQLSDLQHPYLQTINELKFLIKDNKKQVGIIQPCWELGSLKDLVYKVSPFQEWAQKYNKIAENLPASKVALFGGQILEAVIYLYGRGFCPLGHIQSGNIYLEGPDTCRLGGYENTLLKYKARLYRTCANLKCLDDIDIIMFGHVIYEMSAGRELSRLVPNEMDLRCVEDASCREILQYVFSRKDDGKFKRGIIKIQNHWFFGGTGADADVMPSEQRKQKNSFLQKTKKLLKQ